MILWRRLLFDDLLRINIYAKLRFFVVLLAFDASWCGMRGVTVALPLINPDAANCARTLTLATASNEFPPLPNGVWCHRYAHLWEHPIIWNRKLVFFIYTTSSTVLKALEDLRVDLILGERLDLESTKPEKVKLNERGQRVVRTVKGREVAADLLVCHLRFGFK